MNNTEISKDPTGLWDQVVLRLRNRITAQSYEMWLAPLQLVSEPSLGSPAQATHPGTKNSCIVLRAPNSYVRHWFELHFMAAVTSEAAASGVPDLRIEFVDEETAESLPVQSQPVPVPSTVTSQTLAPAQPAITVEVPASPPAAPDFYAAPVAIEEASAEVPAPPELAVLSPRYTFDSFVAGPSNQLAFAASQAAATSYPPKWNPLFLWGGVGLGKTHLLHAIGHSHLAARPSTRVVYISAERFINDYITAVQTRQMHNFRKRYREGIDVLLVDDIQFLAGKDGTQEEFFHTFNALYDAQKQIVLTADRKPNEISDIADRLRTRFQWGLLADIEPPELEVRIAILRKKAAADRVPLPDDVAMYIASAIKSNVRELEGALIRLSATSSLLGRRIDLAFAQESLGGALSRPREIITTDTVMRSVSSYYGVKPADLKSARRHKSIAAPRAVAMYLARQHTSDSYPDLGRAFGGKHHTTVIAAVEKIIARLETDPGLKAEIGAIVATLVRS